MDFNQISPENSDKVRAEKLEKLQELLKFFGLGHMDVKTLREVAELEDTEDMNGVFQMLSIKQKVFIQEFVKSYGNISHSCNIAKVTRNCYYKWKENDKNFSKFIESLFMDDVKADVAEHVLFKQIHLNEDHKAALEYLKKKAKNRGYSDTEEIEETNEDIVKFYIPENGRDGTIDIEHDEID